MPHPPKATTADPREIVDRMKRVAGVTSDAQLGEQLGVGERAVSGWKKRGVPVEHLVAFADRYPVTVAALKGNSGESADRAGIALKTLYRPGVGVSKEGWVINAMMGLGKTISEERMDLRGGAEALALALVEAEQEYRAEHPAESFRASQLADKVITILARAGYSSAIAMEAGVNPRRFIMAIRTVLGLPDDWTPTDPW